MRTRVLAEETDYGGLERGAAKRWTKVRARSNNKWRGLNGGTLCALYGRQNFEAVSGWQIPLIRGAGLLEKDVSADRNIFVFTVAFGCVLLATVDTSVSQMNTCSRLRAMETQMHVRVGRSRHDQQQRYDAAGDWPEIGRTAHAGEYA
jgi:hypothetical protein